MRPNMMTNHDVMDYVILGMFYSLLESSVLGFRD